MFKFLTPDNPRNLAILIDKFQKLEKGVFTHIKKNEFLDLIDYYLTQNKINKAIKILDYATEYYPKCFDLKLTEAQLLIEAKLFKQASIKLKKLYIKKPDNLGLLMLIGINYAKRGIINKSQIFFEKALELLTPKEKSPILYTISQTYIQVNRYDIASLYLKKALKINPRNETIILELAFCLERNSMYQKSMKLYNLYLKKNPFSKLAWYNLGVVYNNLEEPQKAIKAFDLAIAIDPKFSSAIFNKANNLLNFNKNKEAIKEFNKVIYYEKENFTAIHRRGIAYYRSNNLKKAYSDFKSSLKTQKNQSEAWFYLAKLFFKLKKIKRTKKALFEALNLSKLNSEYWELAAKIFLFENNYKAADKAYMYTISFSPSVDKYWFEFSDYKKQIKDISEAISILNAGKEFISDILMLHLKLSSLHLLNKDKKNAIISLKEAKKINSKALKTFETLHPNKKEVAILVNNI